MKRMCVHVYLGEGSHWYLCVQSFTSDSVVTSVITDRVLTDVQQAV